MIFAEESCTVVLIRMACPHAGELCTCSSSKSGPLRLLRLAVKGKEHGRLNRHEAGRTKRHNEGGKASRLRQHDRRVQHGVHQATGGDQPEQSDGEPLVGTAEDVEEADDKQWQDVLGIIAQSALHAAYAIVEALLGREKLGGIVVFIANLWVTRK